tara:strand:- start:2374 stop:2478 length:105 start_codon:yes stop_codon:yes gene_type:complete
MNNKTALQLEKEKNDLEDGSKKFLTVNVESDIKI